MFGYGSGGMMGYGNGWGVGGGMLPFGGVFWLVLLVLGIAAVVWIVRSRMHLGQDAPRIGRGSPGLEILEERYARGEVNRDKYLQKKRDMLGRGGLA